MTAEGTKTYTNDKEVQKQQTQANNHGAAMSEQTHINTSNSGPVVTESGAMYVNTNNQQGSAAYDPGAHDQGVEMYANTRNNQPANTKGLEMYVNTCNRSNVEPPITGGLEMYANTTSMKPPVTESEASPIASESMHTNV